MIGFLIVNIVGYIISIALITVLLVLYFKSEKKRFIEKQNYKKQIEYYTKQLKERSGVENYEEH